MIGPDGACCSKTALTFRAKFDSHWKFSSQMPNSHFPFQSIPPAIVIAEWAHIHHRSDGKGATNFLLRPSIPSPRDACAKSLDLEAHSQILFDSSKR
jgi:hypothetical protein